MPFSRRPALLGALCAALISLFALAAPSRAQEPTAFPTAFGDTAAATAAADSARARRQAVVDSLTQLGLPIPAEDTVPAGEKNPFRYSTTYNINRTFSNWTQALTVTTLWKGIQFSNTTNLTFREDVVRHQRSAQRRTDMRFDYLGKAGFNVGLSINLQRDNDGPVVDGRLTPTSAYNTSAGRLSISKALQLAKAHSLALSFEGGRTGRDENTGAKRTGGGSDFGESATYNFTPGGPFTFQLVGARSVSNGEETGTQQDQVSGIIYETTVKNQNRSLNLSTRSTYTVPWHVLTTTVSASYANSQQQQPTLGQLETLHQKTANADANISAQVNRRLKTTFSMHSDLNRVLSDVDSTRNYDTRNATANMDWIYNTDFWGNFSGNISTRTTINDFRARPSGSLQNVGERNATITGRRDLGHHFSLKLNASGRLNRTRYDDPAAARQNQDYFNRRIGGSLDVRPVSTLPVTFSVQASQAFNHNVFLDARQSSKSATDALYSVEYDVTYKRSPLSITQSYIISADANISEFEDLEGFVADNRYTKSLNYITTMSYQLSPRVRVEADHNLRTTGSGSFDKDALSGVRLFGESSRNTSNVLGVRMSFKLASWINLYVSDRGQFIDQKILNFRGEAIPTSSQITFEYNSGANVVYKFTRWGNLTGNFSRSSRFDRLKSYVNGELSSDRGSGKDFFVITSNFDLVF